MLLCIINCVGSVSIMVFLFKWYFFLLTLPACFRYMAPVLPPYDPYGGYPVPQVPMPPAPIPAPSSYVPIQVRFTHIYTKYLISLFLIPNKHHSLKHSTLSNPTTFFSSIPCVTKGVMHTPISFLIHLKLLDLGHFTAEISSSH